MSKVKKHLPYLICFGIGGAIFLALIISNRIWTLEGRGIFRLLSDACIVPGALLGGVGVLVFATNEGFFDMLTYGIMHIFDLFRPNARNDKYRDYYEYKKARSGRDKHSMAHMLIVGLFFLFLSAIFSFAWSQMN